MKTKVTQYAVIFVVALAIITAGIAIDMDQAEASPPLAPTPVANILQTDEARFFRFQPATALTADTNTSGIDVMEFDSLDVTATIDQGTVNTTTITIQYSNDNTNWDNGTTLVSANAADVTEITRFPVFGRYVRFNQDVTNSNEITITLLAVGR